MRHALRFLSAVVLCVGACSDPSGPGAPQSIEVTGGGEQVGVVAALFAEPITVTVYDARNRPVPNVDVTWTLQGDGTIDRSTVATDRDGRASVRWTAGTQSGMQYLGASAGGGANVAIALRVRPAAAAFVHPMATINMVAEPGIDLPSPLVVVVRDAYGNPVPEQPVRFTPSAGTVSDTLRTTDGNGLATVRWTPGPPGEQSVSAFVPGTAIGYVFRTWAFDRNDIPVLSNGVPVAGISEASSAPRLYRIPVPAGTTLLDVTTEGPNGDVDLFLRPDGLASPTAHECRSTTPLSNEQCLIRDPVATDWYVMLDAWSAYSNVTLTAEWVVGGTMQVDIDGIVASKADVLIDGPRSFRYALGESQVLSGLDPGTYTITAQHVVFENAVYLATPDVQQVEVVAGQQTDVSVTYAVNTDGVNFDIPRAYITQSVQRSDGSVPLVAGRDGLLRVFARASALTDARPPVRARIYQDGELVATQTLTAPGTVPVAADEEVYGTSWNALLPGELIQPGMSFIVDVDPDDSVLESDESDNVYPHDGTPHTPEVRTAAPFMARLVPVVQSANGLVGDVNEANLSKWVDRAYTVYPFADTDIDIRSPYTFTGSLASTYDSTWNRLLNEIRVLRMTDANTRYYYGVIKPSYTRGGTGYGYIGLPAAVGVDWMNHRAETLAHEWGHNFGRLHVDCGGPANPDLTYPHPGGTVVHPGWDVLTGALHSSNGRYDLMSYCNPTWSSDYTYEAVMDFREGEAAFAAAAEPTLVVWGRISDDGVVLEPAFETVTRPVLSKQGGRYALQLSAGDGTTLATLRFDGDVIDHAEGTRHFAYAVPLRILRGRAPAMMRLSGAGIDEVRAEMPSAGPAPDVRATRIGGARVRLQWDAAQNPLAVVRDARTGEILSFARDGSTIVDSVDRELDVELSNGVRSHVRRRVNVQ